MISTKYVKDIISMTCPNGLRDLFDKYPDDIFQCPVRDEAILFDMDKQEDYIRLLDYLKYQAIPTLEDCRKILREAEDGEKVWSHCHMVAGFASYLVRWLNKNNAGLDEELVLAGALLHDIARSQPDHAKAGAQLLLEKGYPRVAAVIATHMDIEAEVEMPLSEAELIYLADKMVMGKCIVSIPDRLAKMIEKNKGNPEACMGATQRLLTAELIKTKVEKILGRAIESIPSFNLIWKNNSNSEGVREKRQVKLG